MQDNELIAQFMNWPADKVNLRDWNVIMEIFDKIEDTTAPENFSICPQPFMVRIDDCVQILVDNNHKFQDFRFKPHTTRRNDPLTKIQMCERAIIEFIKWYNELGAQRPYNARLFHSL